MPDYNGEERRQTDKRVAAMVEQAMNAGFDLDTVDGRNKYRKAIETAYWVARGKEVGGSILFKLVVAGLIGWVLVVLGDGLIAQSKKALGIIPHVPK